MLIKNQTYWDMSSSAQDTLCQGVKFLLGGPGSSIVALIFGNFEFVLHGFQSVLVPSFKSSWVVPLGDNALKSFFYLFYSQFVCKTSVVGFIAFALTMETDEDLFLGDGCYTVEVRVKGTQFEISFDGRYFLSNLLKDLSETCSLISKAFLADLQLFLKELIIREQRSNDRSFDFLLLFLLESSQFTICSTVTLPLGFLQTLPSKLQFSSPLALSFSRLYSLRSSLIVLTGCLDTALSSSFMTDGGRDILGQLKTSPQCSRQVREALASCQIVWKSGSLVRVAWMLRRRGRKGDGLSSSFEYRLIDIQVHTIIYSFWFLLLSLSFV